MPLDDEVAERARTARFRLPVYPAVAIQIAGVLRSDTYDTAALVRAVSLDQAVATIVLRVANSPLYRRGQAVTDLGLALQAIGAKQVQSLALAASLEGQAGAKGPLASLRRRAWMEALLSARLCELLGAVERDTTGLSFIAGLLHDIGKPVALACIEDVILATPGEPPRTEAQWWALVEAQHGAFARRVTAAWTLPPALVAAIEHHHDPKPTDPLTRRVSMADQLVEWLRDHPGVEAADLCRLIGVAAPTAEKLAEEVCKLPEFLRLFDRPGATPEPDTATRPPPAPPAPVTPQGLPIVVLGLGPRPVEGKQWALDAPNVTLTVAEAPRHNVLVRVRLPGRSSTVFCARTGVVASDEQGHRMQLTPFLLSKGQLAEWVAALSKTTADEAVPVDWR